MKHLFKLAVGAAIAGALVNSLMKRRSREANTFTYGNELPDDETDVLVTELVADTQSVGEGSGDDRVLLPDDGRAQPSL